MLCRSFWHDIDAVTIETPCSMPVSAWGNRSLCEVRLAGEQRLLCIDLRSAHPDREINAVFLVDALGQPLSKPAMLSLCVPVGRKGSFAGAAAPAAASARHSAVALRTHLPLLIPSLRLKKKSTCHPID